MIKSYALVAFSREEIANYANENDIKWREDSSNASDKYLRNKIRHDLVPLLKELNLFYRFKNTISFTGITSHG
jgi:tRNA(Ile)-lysidine synthase